MNEAYYQDGQSVLPQSRTTEAMEWEYTDGQSGQIGMPQASDVVTKKDAGFFFP